MDKVQQLIAQLRQQIREDALTFNKTINRLRTRTYEPKHAWVALLSVEEKEDVWHAADEQRYLPLVSSEDWKAQMDGYSIGDPGGSCEILWETQYDVDGVPLRLNEYQETEGFRPGAKSEIMNIYSSEIGDYWVTLQLDITYLEGLMEAGFDVVEALEIAQEAEAEQTEPEVLELGYKPNVEDQAWLIDQNYSRLYCDTADCWDAVVAERRTIDFPLETGVCADRVRFMRLTATERNTRFVRELNYIAAANPKTLRARYAWHRDPTKRGLFWQTVEKHNQTNPEAGMAWLTRSHTVLLNYAFRRRLGINISNGLARAAYHAAENVAEQMRAYNDTEDFNLCDIEAHVCGVTAHLSTLANYYKQQG